MVRPRELKVNRPQPDLNKITAQWFLQWEGRVVLASSDEFVGLDAALSLRVKSTLVRVGIMALIAGLLMGVGHWAYAPFWWIAYAGLQVAMIVAEEHERPADRPRPYALSFAAYLVAGLPSWHMWTRLGDLGIAAATMFLCGMLVQLVVSSLGAKRLFWASATPLIGYLIVVPALAFGTAHLTSAIASVACAVMLVGYLTVLWMGQQRALEAIKASQLRAEAASLAKTDFLATMSHEVRTPMNAVLGAADLLGRTRLTTEQKSHLAMLTDGGAALMHILNDVLDLSKIEAGKLVIDPVATDLHELVRRCVAIWGASAQDKGLDLRVEIDPATPQNVIIDATRTGQIIFNLVSNALKFTERGRVVLTLSSAPSGPTG